MSPVHTAPSSRRSLLAALALPALLAACGEGGGGGRFSGEWKRELSNEGEVKLKLTDGGDLELRLPDRRWPDSLDVRVRGQFRGDTLVLAADTAGMACQTVEARYVLRRAGDTLRVSGVGMDSCGGRRAALVGAWEKA